MLNRKLFISIALIVLFEIIQAMGPNEDEPLIKKEGASASASASASTGETGGALNSIFELWSMFKELYDSLDYPDSQTIHDATKNRGGHMWKRSEDLVEFPHQWHTFKAENGSDPVFVIKDIHPSQFNATVKFLVEHSLRNGERKLHRDIYHDADALKYFKDKWYLQLQQRMSVGCFVGDKMVAVSILNVVRKSDVTNKILDDKQFKPWGKYVVCNFGNWNVRKFNQIAAKLDYDIFEQYKVKRYLCGQSLVISPQYAHFDIERHLLMVREAICHTFDIEVTSSIFTSAESYRLATELHYLAVQTLTFNDARYIFNDLKSPDEFSVSLQTKVYRKPNHNQSGKGKAVMK